MTFLIMQTFSSDDTPYLATGDKAFLILYTLSLHCTTFSSYCRRARLGTAHFSSATADVTFLILWTFSSQHTPRPPTADVTFLILYTLSPRIAQPSPRSVVATFLVLHTFSPSSAGMTFLIL